MIAEIQGNLKSAEFRIRPMRESDLEDVHRLDQVSFSLPWPGKAFRYELLENKNSSLWVAESTSTGHPPTLVGMIVVWLIVDEAHIATLAVKSEYRNRGIAKVLVQVALLNAQQNGANSATLEVRASNHIAQCLYHSLGFVSAGRRLCYYKNNNEDAIIMTLDNLLEEDFSKYFSNTINFEIPHISQEEQALP
jgi:ribosomal-protein-alanine N-acetyltransferase